MQSRHRPILRATPASRQRGVTTLLIVMALFFLVSMVAAYSGRNLVFEQRTSANQYRATQAFEVAEGGVDWALSLLNGGRIDDRCVASTDTAQPSLRGRYLAVDGTRGTVTPSVLAPACLRTDTGWSCSCPTGGEAVLEDPGGPGIRPAFRVKLQPAIDNVTPGVFAIDSTACTTASANCLQLGISGPGEAAARVNVTVALVPALQTLPAAAVTVREDFQAGGTSAVVNEDADAGGLTVHAGSGVNEGTLRLVSVAGNPGSQSVVPNDGALGSLSADAMFRRFFGMSPAAFQRQPAAARFPAATGPCQADLGACVGANPGRPVWVEGDVVIDAPLGSAATPVLLVVNGKVSLADAGVSVVGIVYSRAAVLDNLGAGSLRGALLSEGRIISPSAPDFRYDSQIVRRIRLSQGSVVRLPGGWKDF